MRLSKKNIRHIIYCVLAVCIVAAISFVYMLFSGNTSQKSTVVIAQNSTYEQVIAEMKRQGALENENSFRLTCKLLFYKSVKPGKYVFEKGESNFSMVMKLRKGQHFPVKFTFNNVRTKKQLIQKLSKYEFYFEWKDLERLLNDREFLKNYRPNGEPLKPETVIAIFRPDTYEFYYDITAKEFFEKIYSYYVAF